MEIDITEGGLIRLKKIFNSIILETEEGNRFAICMRDSGLEIGISEKDLKSAEVQKYVWFEAKNGGIKQMRPGIYTIAPREYRADETGYKSNGRPS